MTTKKYAPPREQKPVLPGVVLWCPLCDWHMPDSNTSRRRLGGHVANIHYTEVAFPLGEEPEDLEPEDG